MGASVSVKVLVQEFNELKQAGKTLEDIEKILNEKFAPKTTDNGINQSDSAIKTVDELSNSEVCSENKSQYWFYFRY